MVHVGKEGDLPSVTSRLVTGPAWIRPAARESSNIGLENFMVVGICIEESFFALGGIDNRLMSIRAGGR